MDDAHATSNADAERGHPTFACNLLALTPEQRRIHAEVTKRLGRAVVGVTELADGYAFEYAPQTETLQLLAQFVDHERLCCPFFTFAIRVEPEHGPLWLQLTGPEGIKPFIRAEIDWQV